MSSFKSSYATRHMAFHRFVHLPSDGLGVTTLLAALLLTGALAASGCGESNGTSVATTTPTIGATKSPAGSSSGRGGSPARTRKTGVKRAHLVLPPPGSHPAPRLSASEQAALPVTDISLSSPAITRIGTSSRYGIEREYTCQGSDRSLPLHWSGVPANTKELAIFAISTRPVAGKLYFNWALAGIDPKLTGLQAGQQPPGAVAGRNSAGRNAYSLCPPGGQETYVFLLYAIPNVLHPRPGFDPAAFRAQARQTARHTGLLVGTYAG